MEGSSDIDPVLMGRLLEGLAATKMALEKHDERIQELEKAAAATTARSKAQERSASESRSLHRSGIADLEREIAIVGRQILSLEHAVASNGSVIIASQKVATQAKAIASKTAARIDPPTWRPWAERGGAATIGATVVAAIIKFFELFG